MVLTSISSLPAGGKVQAFEWLVATGGLFMRGGLPPMRSEWWTLETVGDWGMLGRVRDLASMGLCSFLSSDLHRQHKCVNCTDRYNTAAKSNISTNTDLGTYW